MYNMYVHTNNWIRSRSEEGMIRRGAPGAPTRSYMEALLPKSSQETQESISQTSQVSCNAARNARTPVQRVNTTITSRTKFTMKRTVSCVLALSLHGAFAAAVPAFHFRDDAAAAPGAGASVRGGARALQRGGNKGGGEGPVVPATVPADEPPTYFPTGFPSGAPITSSPTYSPTDAPVGPTYSPTDAPSEALGDDWEATE